MKAKSFMAYLPDKEETQILQTKISIKIHEAANRARSEDGLTWREIMEAGLKKYLDDRPKSK